MIKQSAVRQVVSLLLVAVLAAGFGAQWSAFHSNQLKAEPDVGHFMDVTDTSKPCFTC